MLPVTTKQSEVSSCRHSHIHLEKSEEESDSGEKSLRLIQIAIRVFLFVGVYSFLIIIIILLSSESLSLRKYSNLQSIINSKYFSYTDTQCFSLFLVISFWCHHHLLLCVLSTLQQIEGSQLTSKIGEQIFSLANVGRESTFIYNKRWWLKRILYK